MRRLPIFLVIDVSESMAGKAIDDVQYGIKMLTDALVSNPFAMETVYISVIAFAGKAKTITPLTYVMDFIPPKLPIGCGTNLSDALKVLMCEIDTKVKKNTPETKGDWKPLIFILTDGIPNDNYKSAAAAQWKMNYGKYSTIAVLMGENSDATALKAITDDVLVFKETTQESYYAFFKWVSSSIQTSSKEMGEYGKEGNASNIEKFRKNLDADLLADNLPIENNVDFLVLTVRCQKTKKPYIVRYVSHNRSGIYMADGAYPVGEDYFELSSTEVGKNISSRQLTGVTPSCPHCNNPGFGHCNCDKWLCLDQEHLKNVTCPFCESTADYGNYDEFHFNGGRG
ncbi:MAG: VWA domain-containing protein [Lentisphaeria bacterium]|nr:VWA domain-containing protein [Lentisphaeria bacterium]